MNIDMAAIEDEIAAGFISRQRHPTAPLMIYNYTQRSQWDNHWTPEVMACRGLILHDNGSIVARPFAKFFNYDQVLAQIPAEPFEVFEKLDGSLGIQYWDEGRRFIASRGSFTSEQATVATKILREKYSHTIAQKDLTLLFEIIYPENRIVVDYGQRRDLILLAAIHNESGLEIPYRDLHEFGFPVAPRLDGIRDMGVLVYAANIKRDNFEGFVIRFASGFRCKIKLAEYVRLHKLLTGVTPRSVWEELKEGRGIDALIEMVPDEFMIWLRNVETKIRSDFQGIRNECDRVFRTDFASRREAAEYFKQQKYPAAMFRMLDGRSPDEVIWKLVYPPPPTAFRCGSEATA